MISAGPILVCTCLALLGPACSEDDGGSASPAEAVTDEFAAASVPSVDGAELDALLAALPGPRAIGTEAHAATRAFLIRTLQALGYEVRTQPFAWAGAPDAELANIEVRLHAADASAPIVMVGAHYDTVRWSPGADDNGSGVVVLLALARRLAGHNLDADVRLIWFDAEEDGLLGAGAYVKALSPEERERVVGLINLESIGFVDRTPKSQRLPEGVSVVFDPGDRGDFLLVAGNLASLGLTQVVAEALAVEDGADFRVESFGWIPGAGWALPDIRRSDHAPFWDAGLPAVMLTDTANFRNPNYHRSSDTPDTLDTGFLAAACRGVERAVIVLASP